MKRVKRGESGGGMRKRGHRGRWGHRSVYRTRSAQCSQGPYKPAYIWALLPWPIQMVWPQSDLIVFHLHQFYMQTLVLPCTVKSGIDSLRLCLIFLCLIFKLHWDVRECMKIMWTGIELHVLLLKTYSYPKSNKNNIVIMTWPSVHTKTPLYNPIKVNMTRHVFDFWNLTQDG